MQSGKFDLFRVECGETRRYCDGLRRRDFLKIGVAGMASAGLGTILRAASDPESGKRAKDTAVILLWLDGGPGHMDLYDMKPDAPKEYRGLWMPRPTNVAGIEISELFPLQAKIADKFSIIRSLHHGTGDHFNAAHHMLTSRGGTSGADTPQRNPGINAIAAKLCGPRKPGIPAQVAVPTASCVGVRPGYFGGSYLGRSYDPFEVGGNPNAEDFKVQDLSSEGHLDLARLDDRRHLFESLDRFQRRTDQSGRMESLDEFQQKAYDLITGSEARKAFEIGSEEPAIRDLYGRHDWGQSALLARRLVQAGATFVTVHMGGWDHHWDLKAGMENYLPRLDQTVYGLFTDLARLGLEEQVLVVVCGEFSRTPKMNDGGNGGPPGSKGTPGRDHWGNAMFCLMGGGGVRGGQVIGATDPLGEYPAARPLTPGDVHHTIYHVLGIDPRMNFLDHTGRPIPMVAGGSVISELIS